MKVILLKDTPNLGHKGQIVEVSDGHASNFLIPKKFAQPATKDIQTKLAKESKEHHEKQVRELTKFQTLKAELEKRTFTVKVKTGDKGQIFGGIREKDIADVINDKMNAEFDKHQLHIEHPIKQTGEHLINLKLGQGIIANIKINIEAHDSK
jgi:large subunit ribosomal protein L9